jgi:RND superfamily putative drug exporter
VWVALLVVLGGSVVAAGTAFTTSLNLPSSDSSTAYDLLESGGSSAASAETGRVVWHTDGSAVDRQVQARVEPALQQIARVPGAASVTGPFTVGNAGQVSADGHTAYATVTFTSTDNAGQAEQLARSVAGSGLQVEVGGTGFAGTISAGGITELLGVVAALVILLLVFRSAWAAALPILTGVVGVGVSTLLVMLLPHVVTLPDTAITLGALIGLGVGVDYALFIVNRHRKALTAGAANRDAITTALNTSGRAVVFAGATVVIAVLGMLVLGINILSGMGIGAAITVTITVATAITLLPALLAMIGRKVRPHRGHRPDADFRREASAPVLAVYAAHHNGRRPHRARRLRPPRPTSPVPEPLHGHGRIRRRPVLGGFINEYEAAA